jgi:hypothetical protein
MSDRDGWVWRFCPSCKNGRFTLRVKPGAGELVCAGCNAVVARLGAEGLPPPPTNPPIRMRPL